MLERVATGSEGGAYSIAVVAEGRFAYVSGHGPYRDGALQHGELQDDVRLTLANLVETIEQLGGSRGDIVKCNCYLGDIDRFPEFDVAYRSFFSDGELPARTTVGARLFGGMAVEIEAVVVLPTAGDA